MDATRAYASDQPARAINPSAFGTVEHAANNAGALRMRLEQYVDRLCGTVPTAGPSDSKLKGVTSGLLNEALEHGTRISGDVMAMNAALDRLEKQLP
jgi:hypothetical protein